MYLIACSFIAYFCASVYLTFWGPQSLGLLPTMSEERVAVKFVEPNSLADHAGLRAGDLLLAIGDSLRPSVWDWIALPYNAEVRVPLRLLIEREGKQLARVLIPERRPSSYWRSQKGFLTLTMLAAQGVYLTIACLIAFSRPFSLQARLGALFLATSMTVLIYPNTGFYALLRQLPVLVQLLLWIAVLLSALGINVFFSFFAIFPRTLFRSPWLWLLSWSPLIALLPGELRYIFRAAYWPDDPTGAPSWTIRIAPLVWLVYLPLGLLMLLINYRRLTDLTERRRIRVIVAGLAVIVLISVPSLVAWLPASYLGRYLPFFSSPIVSSIAGLSALALPASFAYAILKHRLFDIRVIIRQGLQYAAARNLLILISPMLLALLILDLGWHGNESLQSVMRERGWTYIALAAVAIWLHLRRRDWLLVLDRRFFREAYSAQQVLGATLQEVGQALSLESVAPRAITRIESALHPTAAAILVSREDSGEYQVLAGFPSNTSLIRLGRDSTICRLLHLTGNPLQVTAESGSVFDQLPPDEIGMLRTAGIEWVIPMSNASAVGLLVLGQKKSEQPYTREDLDLLRSIGASLALLLPRVDHVIEDPCLECPVCGACYSSESVRCVNDGEVLVRTEFPAYLKGKFQLEAKIGQGGMGVVYRAADMHLHRRVAVKFLGHQNGHDPAAVARFQREARALAAFAHPNVVTLFDTGNTNSGRVFLVMELLDGHNLRTELRPGLPLPAVRTKAIMQGICAAIQTAHSKSIIHRDLKPENVFITEHEDVIIPKVLDFGLATLLPVDGSTVTMSFETRPDALIGTIRYMSPERLRGEPASEASDLWSIGVIAHEMITGQYPFATVPGAPAFSIPNVGVFSSGGDVQGKRPEWEPFFSRVLACDPSRRPQSAKALLSEFLAVAEIQPE
jgi:hypothetical protein